MRWKAKNGPIAGQGFEEERFLFFPRRINGEWVWLENVKVWGVWQDMYDPTTGSAWIEKKEIEWKVIENEQ